MTEDQQTMTVEQAIDLAATHYHAGRLAEAENIYQQILKKYPDQHAALNVLGVIAQQTGKFALAETLFNKAITVEPDVVSALSNLGNLLTETGRLEEAIGYCRKAIDIDSNFEAAQYNLGNALRQLGQLEEATKHYTKALEINSRFVEAHFNLGITHRDLGKIHEAISQQQKALAIKSDYANAHTEIGHAFNMLGQFTEAQMSLDRGFRINHGGAWWNAKTAEEGERNSSAKPNTSCFASTFKLQDNMDQLEYLIGKRRIDPSFQRIVDRYKKVYDEFRLKNDADTMTELTPSQLDQLGLSYDRVIHYAKAPRISTGAVNKKLAFEEIEKRYLASSTAVITLDNLLTPDALRGLRKFCLESTIYFSCRNNNFVQSAINSGFNCDLLYQIAEELQRYFPIALGGHYLSNVWIYRYNSQTEGVAPHTDQGVVTFNFWITPDDANLIPKGGGLCVYTKEQPSDWDWRHYNEQKYAPAIRQEIIEFLADAESITIPHQQNRAVLFKSSLFHKSEQIDFKDGFENRRINITMLFGKYGRRNEIVTAPTKK